MVGNFPRSVAAPLICLVYLISLCRPAAILAQSPTSDEVSCRLGGPAGAHRYRPGVWGLVEFRAWNATDEPAEVQAVLRFIDDPSIEFSRRVTVPPRSLLRTTCPVRVPEDIPAQRRAIDFLTERIMPPRRIDPKDAPTPQDILAQSQPMVLYREDPSVGRIADRLTNRPPPFEHAFHGVGPPVKLEPDYSIYDMIVAAMRSRKLSRRVASLDTQRLPADVAALDALDVIVLSSDRFAFDPGGISMIRNWVLRGGTLWITLHDVSAETVSAVMGDAFTSVVVDRVEMNSITINNSQLGIDGNETETIELEEPVQFARVLVEDAITTHVVEGWPAAFWQPFGDGRVFFTTLGPDAWMRPVLPSDPPPINLQNETPYYPRPSLETLAGDCLGPRPAKRLDNAHLKPFVSQQIGYQIPNRKVITLILSGFCLLLAIAAWWCSRVKRSERLVWVVPTIAILFAVAFLTMGAVTKRAVPPTAATIARISFETGVGEGRAAGLMAIYNQHANSDRMGAEEGGIFFPDMTAMSGTHRRITWTDEDKWYWENLELPAGVRIAPFERPIPLESAAICMASFGPRGLQGQLTSPLHGLQDAIISIPHQNTIAVKFEESGEFRSGADDVLARGEYLSEAILDDNRVRRRNIYKHLAGARLELDALPRPILFAWCDPVDLEFELPQSTRRNATVFSIPVRFEPTRPGTEVVVPSPFISYRALPTPGGQISPAYANLTHEWVQCSLAVTQRLRFQLPPSVLPLTLSRAKVNIVVRIPSRTLELLAMRQGEPEVVLQLNRPIGSYECTIDQPELLEVDEFGGFVLAIHVGDDESADPGDVMTQAPWLIEQLRVQVAGKVEGEQDEP